MQFSLSMRSVLFAFCLLTSAFLSGCTSRGITITSDPPGAEVSINRRVIGYTPVRVGFTHYGTYRLELRKEKYQTFVQVEKVKPPIYGYDPLAFAADNIIPARLNDEIFIHYVLKPQEEKTERTALLERASLARGGRITHPKTGAEVVVAVDRPLEPGKAVAIEEEPQSSIEVTPGPPPVADLGPAQGINRQPPQGPRLGAEFGLDAPKTSKPSQFGNPNEGKTEAPRDLRIPKSEELIFDDSAVTEAKKKEAPKPFPAPATDPKAADVKVPETPKPLGDLVRMVTTMGTIKIRLYTDKAPLTVANFKELVNRGFYNGILFHRIIDGFMIQGGDPTGTGRGGSGKKIKDEFGPGLKHDRKGLLSMANAGPNTGDSQFFLTLAAAPWLDGKHAIFGEVVEGMDVLDAIGKVRTENARPVEDVRMTTVSLTDR